MKTRYTSETGSIRLILFFIGVLVGLFWKGGQDLYTALSNRQPTTLSYDTYVKTKPKASWLMLTNCVLDLPEAAYRTVGSGNKALELFVPVHTGDSGNEKVQVILATKDPQLMAVCEEMGKLTSKTEGMEWMLKNHERAYPHRDITGLVRFGIDMKEKERKKIAEMTENIADDFIILNEGSKPSLMSGIGFCGGGVVVLLGGVLFMRRNREDSAAAAI